MASVKTTGSRAKGIPGKQGSLKKSSSEATPSKISDKLNPKTVDPFTVAKKRSAFASVYSTGGIPCRLVHGSVKHRLAWDPAPEQVPFDPLLITLAEGFRETVHPYTFVARQGFKELLDVPNSVEKVIPLLSKLAVALRAALGDKDPGVFEAGLDGLIQLSCVVGPHLNPHLKNLLQAISKRSLEKKYRDRVIDALHQIEENGGKESLVTIKAKVPHYTSIFM